ncbi:hypothetical protein ACOBQJ_06700 [Pelotomaculum propionicicum]|uniref:hypothetical protein n=1 Tax=Pelotomaculum propionicicum TaxID=258475 RepID=UPI003B7E15BF
MPKHKFPDNERDKAAIGRRKGKKSTEESEDLQMAEDLFETGAYTNGMMGI